MHPRHAPPPTHTRIHTHAKTRSRVGRQGRLATIDNLSLQHPRGLPAARRCPYPLRTFHLNLPVFVMGLFIHRDGNGPLYKK
jgi:hypothetical protein